MWDRIGKFAFAFAFVGLTISVITNDDVTTHRYVNVSTCVEDEVMTHSGDCVNAERYVVDALHNQARGSRTIQFAMTQEVARHQRFWWEAYCLHVGRMDRSLTCINE